MMSTRRRRQRTSDSPAPAVHAEASGVPQQQHVPITSPALAPALLDQHTQLTVQQHAFAPDQQVQSVYIHVQHSSSSLPPVAAAPGIPAPASATPPAAPITGVDAAMLAQMMQGFIQTATLLQTVLTREQAPATQPALHQDPRISILRDFNSFNPPMFCGHEEPEDADAWLRMTYKLLVASHIPEVDMVSVAQTRMDKMAGAWIASEMALHGGVIS